MRITKISAFVHALDRNPIVRAAPILKSLQRLNYEVEVLGLLPDNVNVYSPFRNAFEYKTSPTIKGLVSKADGDLFYVFKPLPTTILPAFWASLRKGNVPVVLDIEDDDLHLTSLTFLGRAAHYLRRLFKDPKNAIEYYLSRKLIRHCKFVTVSTSTLKAFYGGEIILNGPDELEFNPDRCDLTVQSCRAAFDLPESKFLVLFAGYPRIHKGFLNIIKSVQQTDCVLVLAGANDEQGLFKMAIETLGAKCIHVGAIDNSRMPHLLSAVNVVPIPQLDTEYARAQLPAKLIEAMAMAKPTVVTQVGDLPSVVGYNTREQCGIVIAPDDVAALTASLNQLKNNQTLYQKMALNARKRFLAIASVSENAKIIHQYLKERNLN